MPRPPYGLEAAAARAGAAARRERARIRRRRLTAAVIALAALIVLVAALSGSGGLSGAPPARDAAAAAAGAPFAYRASQQAQFSARAAAGSAQVLFTKSPGGIVATAARVASYRGQVDAAVRGTGIPANLLEGLVFLESAGRSEVIAGSDAADAAGLTQILAATGQSLLGMHIDLARSRVLTAAIETATELGQSAKVARLERARAAADDRFDPRRELAATVRYLAVAQRDLGRLDLALAAYHAGIGNIEQVLRDYDGGGGVPYAQLYFDTAPDRHAAAWSFLSNLGDDSSLYYWRVLEAERIMSLYRTDRAALVTLSGLETGYPSTAEVLLNATTVPRFGDPSALADGYAAKRLVPLPRNAAALHLAYAPSIGAPARRLGVPASLYRGLTPSATSMLIAIAAWVDALSGARTPLTVASAVLDSRSDRLLGIADPPATTGQTFEIERQYGSGAQAAAFQFVLDRLQALNLIAWFAGPSTIEITVAPDAGHVLAHGI